MPETSCIWHGCDDPPEPLFDTPLCRAHVLHVWATVDEQIEAVKRWQQEAPHENEVDPKAAARQRRNDDGHIYYLRIDGHIKVGFSKAIIARLQSYPPTSQFLVAHPGTRRDESELHARFREHCVAGREWYKPNPELMQHIDQMAALHGTHDPRRRIPKPPAPSYRS